MTMTRSAALLISIVLANSESPAPAPPDDPLASVANDPHTLSQLLQWSLQHQDLDALHAKAEAVRSGDAAASLPAPEAGAPSAAQVRPGLQPLTPERRKSAARRLGRG